MKPEDYFKDPTLRDILKVMLEDAKGNAKKIGLKTKDLVLKRIDRVLKDIQKKK